MKRVKREATLVSLNENHWDFPPQQVFPRCDIQVRAGT